MGAVHEAIPIGSVDVSAENAAKSETPDVILVPCAECARAGCRIVAEAVKLVTRTTPEIGTASPADCPRGVKQFIVAIDASSACRASQALKECGVRPSVVLSAADILADKGALKPGLDIYAHLDEFARLVADTIRDSLQDVLEEARERRRYREEMAPIIGRFRSMWPKIEALPEPNGLPDDKQKAAVELLAKRSRNLFMKFDEVVPPAQWSEPHDLFQDALLCVAYAVEGWASGDSSRWEQNMEKARIQIKPLLRRLDA